MAGSRLRNALTAISCPRFSDRVRTAVARDTGREPLSPRTRSQETAKHRAATASGRTRLAPVPAPAAWLPRPATPLREPLRVRPVPVERGSRDLQARRSLDRAAGVAAQAVKDQPLSKGPDGLAVRRVLALEVRLRVRIPRPREDVRAEATDVVDVDPCARRSVRHEAGAYVGELPYVPRTDRGLLLRPGWGPGPVRKRMASGGRTEGGGACGILAPGGRDGLT